MTASLDLLFKINHTSSYEDNEDIGDVITNSLDCMSRNHFDLMLGYEDIDLLFIGRWSLVWTVIFISVYSGLR